MREALKGVRPYAVSGATARVNGFELEVRGLRLRLGDPLLVAGSRPAEVIALDGHGAKALLIGDTHGLGAGDRVVVSRRASPWMIGPELLGRVVDGLGRPLDGGPPISGRPTQAEQPVPEPLTRKRIGQPLSVGVKVIDTLCTTGRGQRIGIFGGSGVGKSTLLGMMLCGTEADVNVVALVGERGREVREFIEDELGEEGMARSVVVVATSDQPALMRLRAAMYATRVAEYFADEGADVLMVLDSLTRLAMAQREIGLAAGEPPTARGYTPSVFALLPRLLERAGPRRTGTITAFYTVLVEGDDMNDPIADTARSILDGHIVLDRRMAIEGRYPAVDPLSSLSRLAARLLDERKLSCATAVRSALAAAAEVRDLVEIGAYVPGTNLAADRGLAAAPALNAFLAQRAGERIPADGAWEQLFALTQRLGLS
jgi:flagellum-specific ATP synthase